VGFAGGATMAFGSLFEDKEFSLSSSNRLSKRGSAVQSAIVFLSAI